MTMNLTENNTFSNTYMPPCKGSYIYDVHAEG